METKERDELRRRLGTVNLESPQGVAGMELIAEQRKKYTEAFEEAVLSGLRGLIGGAKIEEKESVAITRGSSDVSTSSLISPTSSKSKGNLPSDPQFILSTSSTGFENGLRIGSSSSSAVSPIRSGPNLKYPRMDTSSSEWRKEQRLIQTSQERKLIRPPRWYQNDVYASPQPRICESPLREPPTDIKTIKALAEECTPKFGDSSSTFKLTYANDFSAVGDGYRNGDNGNCSTPNLTTTFFDGVKMKMISSVEDLSLPQTTSLLRGLCHEFRDIDSPYSWTSTYREGGKLKRKRFVIRIAKKK